MEGEQTRTMWIIMKRFTRLKITQLLKIRKSLQIEDVVEQSGGIDDEENDLQPESRPHDIPAWFTRRKSAKWFPIWARCHCCCRSHCSLSFHTRRVPRGYRFCRELPPIYILKPILVESICVSDLRVEDCEEVGF